MCSHVAQGGQLAPVHALAFAPTHDGIEVGSFFGVSTELACFGREEVWAFGLGRVDLMPTTSTDHRAHFFSRNFDVSTQRGRARVA